MIKDFNTLPTEQQPSSTPVLPELQAPFSALRPEYLELVDRISEEASRAVRFCAAKIINCFQRWKNWKMDRHRTPWTYLTLKLIRKELCGEHGIHTIRKAIAFLIDGGLLERRNNPGNGQDRTYQYNLLLEGTTKPKKQKSSSRTRMTSPFDPNESPSDPDELSSGTGDKYHRYNSTEIRSTHSEKSEKEDACQVETVSVLPDTTFPTSDEDLWSENTSEGTVHEDEFSAPPSTPTKHKKSKPAPKATTTALFLLDEPVFILWWAKRVSKTKFGSEQLEMPPEAYVKARIRKQPEQALDMWDSFQDEMSKRVANCQLRQQHGIAISPTEEEEIKAIAPYATSQPSLPEAPGGENSEAYKLYQPKQVETAPPPAGIFAKLKQAATSLSMPTKASKVNAQLSDLDELNQWIADPILRSEAMKRIMASDLYTVEYNEEGVPYQVRKV